MGVKICLTPGKFSGVPVTAPLSGILPTILIHLFVIIVLLGDDDDIRPFSSLPIGPYSTRQTSWKLVSNPRLPTCNRVEI